MAKRIINWVLNNATLSMIRYNTDKDADQEIMADFDVSKIYANFDEMNDIQKQIIVYGSKQKLADCGASVSTAEEKSEKAKAKWIELLDGKWIGERVNATGSAENKKRLKNMETLSKVVSLDGLMMKKLNFPESFTKADQTKLDEFMAIAVKHQAKAKKAKK